MSETADYDPGPWTGYNFNSLRASYDAHVGRSYGDAVSKNVAKEDLYPKSLTTDSPSPLVIVCDVTGSMGDWPATIFSKLPYLDIEGKEYLGDEMAISFAAVGDVFSDKYPVQVQPFVSGKELEETLKKLVIESGGGGQQSESYDFLAYYYANYVEMPKAVNPIIIFIGDENLYDFLDKTSVQNLFEHTIGRIPVEDVFAKLKSKYSVYLIRKTYSSGDNNPTDKAIHGRWASILGDDHICPLPDASRVVDVIFGILAKETGKIGYFADEIKDRQRPDQVDEVMKSLVSVHNPDSIKKIAGNVDKSLSITKRTKSAGKSKSLLS